MSADQVYAKVIADSITDRGHRVTTMEARIHRFVLAEANTHRVIGGRTADQDANDPGFMEEFSRNSASSRAIPLRKQIEKVATRPAVPVVFPAEQKGMQGGEPVADQALAEQNWKLAAVEMAQAAQRFGEMGVHKSVANRLLEPFLMHTVVLTATNWDGFYEQRCSPLAQPEIKVAAEAMRDAHQASEPVLLGEGEWHLPYVEDEDIDLIAEWLEANAGGATPDRITRVAVKSSTARCARVSYETQPILDPETGRIIAEARRDVAADLDLYDRLVKARPPHWSPLEHPCTPWPENVSTVHGYFTDLDGNEQNFKVVRPLVGNLLGFRQHRFEMETATA